MRRSTVSHEEERLAQELERVELELQLAQEKLASLTLALEADQIDLAGKLHSTWPGMRTAPTQVAILSALHAAGLRLVVGP